VRATMFTRRDTGVGYLVGAADEAQITRTFYVDTPTAERLCQRARAARQTAGTLQGHAAGEPTSPRRDTLLADILTVVPAGESKVWSETLLERLQALRPEGYGDMSRDQLTAALKAHGITTTQVWGTTPQGEGANRRGIHRQAVAEAAAATRRRPAADQAPQDPPEDPGGPPGGPPGAGAG
jgi:DNA segregation ATPase FtsK/SpoIIIE, S-DNA-T family